MNLICVNYLKLVLEFARAVWMAAHYIKNYVLPGYIVDLLPNTTSYYLGNGNNDGNT